MSSGPIENSIEQAFYTAYPFQVIDYPSGVILRRGNTRILVEGEDAIPTVLLILKETSGSQSTKQNILQFFPTFRHEEIASLLNELIDKRFLVDVDQISKDDILDEKNADIFFWQLGRDPSDLNRVLDAHRVFIFGQNRLSKLLKDSISQNGFQHVKIVPYGPLNAFPKTKEELEAQSQSFDHWQQIQEDFKDVTIIGASEFGGQFSLLELNEFCVQNDVHFLPTLADNMRAHVGPFVIPGETACLQCLRSRQNAHLHNIYLERYTEIYAQQGQEIAATHVAILKSAAEIAAFELLRAYGGFVPDYKPSLIDINLLNTEVSGNTVLKVPRCEVCSTLNNSPDILSTKPSP